MEQNTQSRQMAIDEDEVNVWALIDILYLDKRFILLITMLIAMLGTAYAFLAKPVLATPGDTQFTFIPEGAASLATPMVKPMIPALLAA